MTTYAAPAVSKPNSLPILMRGGSRIGLISTLLGGAAAVIAAVLLIRPWPVRNSFLYAELAPVRDGIWNAILVDALAFAVVAIALSIGVASIARARGSRLASFGAIVTTAAGVLFAMGAFAFASLTWYATDPAALSAAEGTRLLEYVVANPEHVMLPQMLGFLMYTVGSLILAAALLRSRAVPRWLPVAFVVATLAQFGFHDRLLDFVQIATMGTVILIAWYLPRAQSGETQAP